jgi:hypothetical protein
MTVLSKLQTAGVKLCADLSSIDCNVHEPTLGSIAPPSALITQENPLVSCLMMTRGNIDIMRYSLACYRRQKYAHRELVVVAGPDAGEKVHAFFASQEALDVRVFVAPPDLTIGDHRNLATARARGAILVNWDDDDLSDPRRLDIAVQVLRQTGAAAVFLSRLLVWWPQRKVAAIVRRRVWEQTIAAWRSHMPIYALLPRGGDAVAIERLAHTHRVALVDFPLLYVYAVTGRNLWDASHFEGLVSSAECIFEGEEFHELNELLSDRLPILDYAASLNEEGANWGPPTAI